MNRITLLLFDILKNRKTSLYLKEFNHIKSTSKGEIKTYQFEKLKALLIHAEKNVPFYQKRFKDSKFSTVDFTSIEQLVRIPPLSRQDLQGNWRDIVASNYKISKLTMGSSSGSSGQPVNYFKDSIATSAGQAANILGWTFSGWKMNMKGLHIWGNPSIVRSEWAKPSSKLKARLFSHHKFPAYQLVDAKYFNKLYCLIIKNRYEYLDGYTNAIYLFADFLKNNKLTLKNSIKYVLTTAENLHEFQRQTIQETIASVYDTYGCSEINGIAFECSQCKKYHVIDPHVYVEFGELTDNLGSRELLVTDLDNWAFPLIRYKNNDMGIPTPDDENDCLIKFSRIGGVSGRESDLIRLKDGGVLSVPSFFGSMLLKQIRGLTQYQIEKIENDLIQINLVKTNEFTPNDQRIVNAALKEYLADKIRYQIKYVDRIESSSSGKIKLVIDRTKK